MVNQNLCRQTNTKRIQYCGTANESSVVGNTSEVKDSQNKS